jgi:hypothetical protein
MKGWREGIWRNGKYDLKKEEAKGRAMIKQQCQTLYATVYSVLMTSRAADREASPTSSSCIAIHRFSPLRLCRTERGPGMAVMHVPFSTCA